MTKQVQYPYAYDENNNLVFVGDIEREHRHDHTYHCPNCGHSMLPRLGDHNAKHFYHSDNQQCGLESYIHIAAKEILSKKFNEGDSFFVSFSYIKTCNLRNVCTLDGADNCEFSEFGRWDLKKYYDSLAEVEVKVTEQDGVTFFRPDILLHSSNPKRGDIFIEVYHKHPSNVKKLCSDHQIIEIHIRNTEDLRALEKCDCLFEGDDTAFINFKRGLLTPDQITQVLVNNATENGLPAEWGLPECKYKQSTHQKRKFILYKSGKHYDMGILEGEENNHNPSALIEIVYNATKIDNPLKILAIKDHKYRFCELCDNCITSLDDDNRWCRLVKNGSKRKGTFNNTKGTYCAFFKWRESGYNPSSDGALVEGVDYTIWYNPNN